MKTEPEHQPAGQGSSEDQATQLARVFHNIYEKLAPDFGYETRKETRDFEPTTPNGKLMIAVCEIIIRHHLPKPTPVTASELEQLAREAAEKLYPNANLPPRSYVEQIILDFGQKVQELTRKNLSGEAESGVTTSAPIIAGPKDGVNASSTQNIPADAVTANKELSGQVEALSAREAFSKRVGEATHGTLESKRKARGRVGLRRGIMNGVEKEFALMLEAQKRAGEILRYEFEGITLRFANVKYTPDFVVIEQSMMNHGWTIKLIEVKGPFIKGNRERAVERFRHAKTYWPEFTFELHQKTRDGWKQLI